MSNTIEMQNLRQQIQQELDDISNKEMEIMKWYSKPRCQQKEDARLRLGELLDYRNRLLARAEELGYTYVPEEISKNQVRYVLKT
jgi:ElaB/YqjD/DUF883 family membrane-anchored ribosome-binding protein